MWMILGLLGFAAAGAFLDMDEGADEDHPDPHAHDDAWEGRSQGDNTHWHHDLTGDDHRDTDAGGHGGDHGRAALPDVPRSPLDTVDLIHSPPRAEVVPTETDPPNHHLEGTPGADRLTGGLGPDIIAGRDGNDTLAGRGGDDQIAGYAGNDHLKGGAGNDDLRGDDGDDHLQGGTGNDHLAGGDGHDAMSGGKGNDTLAGGSGNDRLHGGAGDDSLIGGQGDDHMDGGRGNDALLGGDGNDTLVGGEGHDTLVGGAGDNRLSGDGPGHRPEAQPARDHLDGGAGNDTLIGGAGGDWLTGGEGHDTFHLPGNVAPDPADADWAPAGATVVTDYNPAEDRLVVIYDAAAHPTPHLTLAPDATHAGDTQVFLDGRHIATIQSSPGLTAADLHLMPAAGADAQGGAQGDAQSGAQGGAQGGTLGDAQPGTPATDAPHAAPAPAEAAPLHATTAEPTPVSQPAVPDDAHSDPQVEPPPEPQAA